MVAVRQDLAEMHSDAPIVAAATNGPATRILTKPPACQAAFLQAPLGFEEAHTDNIQLNETTAAPFSHFARAKSPQLSCLEV